MPKISTLTAGTPASTDRFPYSTYDGGTTQYVTTEVLANLYRDFSISLNFGALNAASAYAGGTVVSVECPYSGVIESIRMLGTSTAGTVSGAGTATLDIYKASYANFPSMGTAQSICGTATKPNLTGTAAYENTSLTGFTTAFSKGDWLTFVVVNSGFVWTGVSVSGHSTAVS